MAYLPGQQYVQNAAGAWVPLSLATAGASMPTLHRDSAGVVQGLRPDGFANMRQDPTTLLFDTFETLDTTNTWTLGGTVVPIGANGSASAGAGTAASATSRANSQANFSPGSGAYLQYAALVQVEAAVLTGATRWWGIAAVNTTPTTTTPVTNGTVFELRASDGLLYGSVYSGGALTQSVALTRPTDGAVHRYQILYKSSRAYFNIDNVELGSIAFPNPTVATLPVSFGTVNGAAILAAAAVLNLSLVGIGDTAPNSLKLSDGNYPWRKAQVRATGALDVNLASSASSIVTPAAPTNGQFAAVTANSAVTWAVPSAGNATLAMQGGSYTVLPIIFEASPDNQANWFPVDGTQLDGTGVNTSTTLGVSSVRAWNFPIPGYTHLRVRLFAAATVVTQPTWVLNQGAFLFEPSPTVAPIDGQKASYTANISGLATNTAIDLSALLGSATRTVRVTRVDVELLVTTASTALSGDLRLVKRTTAGVPAAAAGGTTLGALDSTDVATTAAASGYAVAGTAGTQVAVVRAGKIPWAVGRYNYSWDLGRITKAAVLRGTAERLILLQSAALTGGVFQWSIIYDYTEE